MGLSTLGKCLLKGDIEPPAARGRPLMFHLGQSPKPIAMTAPRFG